MTSRLLPDSGLRQDETIRLAYLVTHPMTARFLLHGQLTFLSRQGFEIFLLTSPGQDLEALQSTGGVTCIPVSMCREIRPLRDLTALVKILRELRQIRPAIVSASTPKAGLLGALASFLLDVPCRIYTLRGLRLETAHGWRRHLLATSEKLAAACVHKVICVSKSLRSRYHELGLAPVEKTLVLGEGSSNGVDTRRFHPQPEAADQDLRLRLGLPEGAPVVGFVGRLTRDKGIEDLATAFFDRVLPRFPSARLLIVGEFEAGDPVSEFTRRTLDDSNAVVRTGFIDGTPACYRLMDVLAFPSRREGFPNAPLEAAATAVPVVAYAATGTIDAVVDGATGKLVTVGRMDELGDALCDYLADPRLRQRHGEYGRTRVLEQFRGELVWRRWEAFYRECLGGNT
jgi:glycosyltransferase involved in cell wall biosynthesis